jgi:hypothetical protein
MRFPSEMQGNRVCFGLVGGGLKELGLRLLLDVVVVGSCASESVVSVGNHD